MEVAINPVVRKIISSVKKLTEEEQRSLLIQINAKLALKNPNKYKIIDKPVKVSMTQIDKWKHEARKYAK